DYDRSIADYTQAIDLLKRTATADVIASAYVTRAAVYSLKADFANALADYRTAFEIDKSNDLALDRIKGTKTTMAALGIPLRTVDVPNDPLPAEVPIDPEILRLIQTHPFFANTPPV